ncbi:Alpha/Beta hydrolase protein [Leptodontidium sp. MPI-SDFR-AT-0119]|nr:Alpha/Beta hydrolase protein [Leptodontidium sp. MPI-SDFR-AT-0119]
MLGPTATILGCLLLCSRLPLARSQTSSNDLTVNLNYSTYQGFVAPQNISQWRGIRFAAPPTGERRFRNPQDPLVNESLQIADTFGPSCLASEALTIPATSSEDCLFLNVFRPAIIKSKPLPVWIFIQGGGFNRIGNANWDPTAIIKASGDEILVVTFNYRVSLYGFLTSREIVEDGDLNVGLFDQRKVFQWVQTHISKFGGDPNSVMIGGDSAGAASVDLHLSAYGGKDEGLFHRAYASSPSFGAQLTVAESQYQYDSLVERVGCSNATSTLKCLRDIDIALLQSKNVYIPTPGGAGGNPVFMYSNVIDGNFTPDYTYNLYHTGQFLKIPILMGNCANEGTNYVPKTTSTVAEMNSFLRNQFAKLTAAQLNIIDKFWPQTEQFPNSSAYWRATSNAYGEIRYNCPGIAITSAYDEEGVANTYLYNYNVKDPALDASGTGVSHVANTFLLWGLEYTTLSTASKPASYYPNGTNAHIGPILRGYWTSFIRTGDPNPYSLEGTPVWERFDRKNLRRMNFETNSTAMQAIPTDQKARCRYASGIGGSLGL